MGAVREFNFGDFKNEILSKLGAGSKMLESRTNIKMLKSIFDSAAKNDGGEKAELLETDMNGFQRLVDNTIDALNNEGNKGWLEKILGSKLYQRFFPNAQKETDEVELVTIEAGLAESVQDKPNNGFRVIKKLEKPSKEEMISRLNEHLETPLSPDATDEEIRAAMQEVAKKQQSELSKQAVVIEETIRGLDSGLVERAQDKPNSEYGVIKKLEIPSREEMISSLNEHLETPLSPDATVEEIRAAVQEIVEKQRALDEKYQEAYEMYNAMLGKKPEASEVHFGF